MVWKTYAAVAALLVLAAAPATLMAQDTSTTTTTTTSQTDYFMTFPQPEQGYVMTIYNRIPVSNQPQFVTWLQGFQPEQQRLVIRALNAYSLGGPNVVAFTDTTTPDVAMPVFVDVLSPADQPEFRTFWTGMTPEQQTTFISTARYVYPATATSTDTTVTTTSTPPSDAGMTTDTTTTMTTGSAGQPFTTVTFAAFLPATARAAFETMAPTVPNAELGGIQYFLSQFTPEQAGMVVRALATINSNAMSGNANSDRGGMTDTDARALVLANVDAGDRSAFESMWSGMTPNQQFILMQLARDAYNGGFNDIGASAATGGSTTTTMGSGS